MFHRQNKLGFPVDYGDTPVDDESQLSVIVVKGIKSKWFRDVLSGVCSIILIVGSNARPVNAIPLDGIPVEAGACIAQAAAEAASEMPKAVPAAVVGTAALAPGPAPLENVPGALGHQSFTKIGAPGQPPIFIGLPRPVTTPARIGNTIAFGGSVGWICINAYWGNPAAIAGCSVMVATWFFSVLF